MSRTAVPRFAIVLVALLINGACSRDEPSLRDGDIFRTRVLGASVQSNDEILRAFAGEVQLSEVQLIAAACHNRVDWLDDVTLNNSIVVSQAQRHYAAAHLVMSGAFDIDFVQEIERQAISGSSPVLSLDLRKAGYSDDDLAEYLAAVTQQESLDVNPGVVVYAVNSVASEIDIVALDVSRSGAQSTSRGTMTVVLPSSPEERIELDDSVCDDLVE